MYKVVVIEKTELVVQDEWIDRWMDKLIDRDRMELYK